MPARRSVSRSSNQLLPMGTILLCSSTRRRGTLRFRVDLAPRANQNRYADWMMRQAVSDKNAGQRNPHSARRVLFVSDGFRLFLSRHLARAWLGSVGAVGRSWTRDRPTSPPPRQLAPAKAVVGEEHELVGARPAPPAVALLASLQALHQHLERLADAAAGSLVAQTCSCTVSSAARRRSFSSAGTSSATGIFAATVPGRRPVLGDVGLVQAQRRQEVHRALELGLGLATEAHDHVGVDGHARNSSPHCATNRRSYSATV